MTAAVKYYYARFYFSNPDEESGYGVMRGDKMKMINIR